MKKSRIIAAAAGAALVAGLVGAPGAQAEDTTVTFTVVDGTVSIAVVDAGNLSDPVANPLGMTASGALGTVTVTDTKADLLGWTVTAAMADPFSAGGSKTIACDTATLSSESATTVTKTGTVTYAPVGGALAANATTAEDTDDCGPTTMAAGTLAAGANSVEFDTNISIAIPGTAQAGDYSGTVVQTAVATLS